MEKASKNFIANLKKQKREDKSLLFLDNVKIIRDAVAGGTMKVFCVLTTLDDAEFEKLNLGLENAVEGPNKVIEGQMIEAQKVEKSCPSLKTDKKQAGEKGQRQKADKGQVGENESVFGGAGVNVLRIDQATLQQLADTKTPQKVLCVAYHTQHIVVVPKTNFLVLDGLQDPGNVGTLIRTAKAAGFESVFLLDSVRTTNPKLVRSSVGAVLSENVFEMSRSDFANFAKTHKLQLVCCDMNGENVFTFQPKGVVGVVVGNEGQGVSEEIAALCSKTVKIPMCSGIESLNAAVSGAIVMYQISKNKFC